MDMHQPSMWEKSVGLTPPERRLLTCLVRNAGRIVSHGELMEAMSSGNHKVGIGSLPSCISRLRNKIELDPALPGVIITHHRQGYSFTAKEGARWSPESRPP